VSTEGELCGSDHAAILLMATWCWCTIAFNWSTYICGTLKPENILICSIGMEVKSTVFGAQSFSAAVLLVVLVMAVMGLPLILTRVSLRRVEHHVGKHIAGVDGKLELRIIVLSYL